MAYGVTDAGFVPKTQAQILADLQAAQSAAPEIGPTQDFSATSPLGQLNGTLSADLAELWELAEAVYASQDPDAATGEALIALCALTGTVARAATATTVGVTLTLAAGTTVPAAARMSVDGRPDIVFELDADVTNGGGSPADFPGTATCTETGPIAVNAGTLTVIDSVTSGWTYVTNALDGAPGRNADDPITLRQRRSDELALRGGSTAGAIKADILDTAAHPELDGIRQVVVFNNRSSVTDANGVPARSFEVVIDDGVSPSVADNAIAQAIFDSAPAGSGIFGSASGIATDVDGNTTTVPFSRYTPRAIYLSFTLTTNAHYPGDGDAQVKAALAAAGGELTIGDDVIALALRAACFSVSGVVDVPTFFLDFTATPVLAANLVIGARERAVFDTSRMVRL